MNPTNSDENPLVYVTEAFLSSILRSQLSKTKQQQKTKRRTKQNKKTRQGVFLALKYSAVERCVHNSDSKGEWCSASTNLAEQRPGPLLLRCGFVHRGCYYLSPPQGTRSCYCLPWAPVSPFCAFEEHTWARKIVLSSSFDKMEFSGVSGNENSCKSPFTSSNVF